MSLSNRPSLGDTVVLFRGIFFPTGGSRHRFRPAEMLVGSERGMRLTPGVMGGEVTPVLQTITAELINSFIYVSIYSVWLEGWNKRQWRKKFGVFSRPVFTQIFRISFEMGKLAFFLRQEMVWFMVAVAGSPSWERYNSTSCWSFPNNSQLCAAVGGKKDVCRTVLASNLTK